MKLIHLFTYSLGILFLLCSCGGCGKGRIYTYTMRNESGVPIKLNMYKNGDSLPRNITHIDHNEEIVKEENSYPPTFLDYDFARFLGGEGLGSNDDSLHVIYANTKREIFFGGFPRDTISNDRNPLNTNVYRNQEETFIFTEEDYQNAEDCGGDCE